MMNDDMLRNIEYLREKADVSYEEAATLLERYDGNVMRVLVELERQGRVFQQEGYSSYETPKNEGQAQPKAEHKSDTKEKATGIINKAMAHRIVVESGKGDKKETIANISAPYAVGAAVVAPHLTVASVALMFLLGYRVKFKKGRPGEVPDDMEKTVDNIKTTASSVTETVRSEFRRFENDRDENQPQKETPVEHKDYNDHNDEGGEITVD